MEWHFDGTPDAAGWYAVLVCYDAEEGAFPMGAEWDGAKWKQRFVAAFGDRCETADEAKDLAYDNDPDNPNS